MSLILPQPVFQLRKQVDHWMHHTVTLLAMRELTYHDREQFAGIPCGQVLKAKKHNG